MKRTALRPVTALILLCVNVCACAGGLPQQGPWKGSKEAKEPKFTFAVISDRTGAHTPGVLAAAVEEINLLNPDFVMCIGDLIEGCWSDADLINEEWDGFDAIISKLRMPFCSAFGNHDVYDSLSRRIVHERYGPVYYSFDYKNCHFIVLCTEIPGENGEYSNSFGEEQTAWLEKDLAASKDSAHTFVFFHKPWILDNRTQPLKRFLGSRPSTIFTGHWHHYVYSEDAGRQEYVLASTGGGMFSSERKCDFFAGYFYHYMVVNVDGSEVSIANVRLGHVLPGDSYLFSRETLGRVGALRSGAAPGIVRVPRDAAAIQQQVVIEVTNPLEEITNPAHSKFRGGLRWELPEDCAWKVEPIEQHYVLARRGDKATLEFKLTLDRDPRDGGALPLPVFHSFAHAMNDDIFSITGELQLDFWPYAASLSALRNCLAHEPVPASEHVSKKVAIELKNVLDEELRAELRWVCPPDCRWKVTPQTVWRAQLKPSQSEVFETEVEFEGAPPELFPLPRLEAQFECAGFKILTHTQRLSVDSKEFLGTWRRRAAFTTTAAAPAIDGRIDDACWKAALPLGSFIELGGKWLALHDTTVRLLCDDSAIYIAAEMDEPCVERLRAEEQFHDPPFLGLDDSFEVFIVTEPDESQTDHINCYHFMANSSGTLFEERRFNSEWNGTWRSKAARGERSWTMEIAIPWETIGGKPAGGKLAMNLCRNRSSNTSGAEQSCWAPCTGAVHKTSRFGLVTVP